MTTALFFGGVDGSLEVRAAQGGAVRLRGSFPYRRRAILNAGHGRKREEVFAPRAFAARIDDPEADIYLLAGHDYARPLASREAGTLEIRDTDNAVTLAATLSSEVLETTHGRDALALLKAGLATGLSPGFAVPPDGEALAHEGEAILRTIRRADLFEFSIVTRAAYPAAKVEPRHLISETPRAGLSRALRRWRP